MQGAGRNITYPVGMNGGAIGGEWGLDRESYVVVDRNGIIQYITPQSTHYTQRLTQHADEIFAKLDELISQTGISPNLNKLPVSYNLYQNSPNPFVANTKIQLDLGQASNSEVTQLVIYDILGREVRSLFSGYLGEGKHSFHWNAVDNNNLLVSSGTYFVLLKSGKYSSVKKMLYTP
jgi:flagellar hook assembly protein FlgD